MIYGAYPAFSTLTSQGWRLFKSHDLPTDLIKQLSVQAYWALSALKWSISLVHLLANSWINCATGSVGLLLQYQLLLFCKTFMEYFESSFFKAYHSRDSVQQDRCRLKMDVCQWRWSFENFRSQWRLCSFFHSGSEWERLHTIMWQWFGKGEENQPDQTFSCQHVG
jgi:hypothetical protein